MSGYADCDVIVIIISIVQLYYKILFIDWLTQLKIKARRHQMLKVQ